MLKITVENTGKTIRLQLDGELSGPWVAELERTWSGLAKDALHSCTLIDLTEITHMNAEGRRLLEQMVQQGAKLKGCGIMTRNIIQQIELSAEASKHKTD